MPSTGNNIESVKDNPIVATLLADPFADVGTHMVLGYIQDSKGTSHKISVSVDDNGYEVGFLDGLQSDLNCESYDIVETALTAKVSEADAAKIVAVIKEYQAKAIEVNKKYAEYFDDLYGWWTGPDDVNAKRIAEYQANHKAYKITYGDEGQARIWQTIGSANVAFEINHGFYVIVK